MPPTEAPTSASPPARSTQVLPPSDENAFRTLIRTFGLLDRVMHPYFARFGISGAQWGVLRQIHAAEQQRPEPLRMTELSERLIIRPASVTGVIDRLARDGFVRRTALPTDLRVKLIQLTDKGRGLVERVLAVHDQQIAKVLGGLSAVEQKEFQRLLTRLGQHLEKLVEKLADGDDATDTHGNPACEPSSES